MHPSWARPRTVPMGPRARSEGRGRGDFVGGADGEECLSTFWVSGVGYGDGAGGGRGGENVFVAYGVGTKRPWLWRGAKRNELIVAICVTHETASLMLAKMDRVLQEARHWHLFRALCSFR